MHVRSLRVALVSLVLGLAFASVARAQATPVGFSEPPARSIEMRPIPDADLEALLITFRAVMTTSADLSDPAADPDLNLWKFQRWLQSGVLSPEQQGRVLEELARIGAARPDLTDRLEQQARAVRTLSIGRPAPEILGTDLEGQPLRLSDYRGKVVVLTFTGEWCAICRAEYPYQRLLQELYRDLPFALLGVSSDASVAAAAAAKSTRGLPYRAWWEPKGDGHRRGPIASTYNLYGWPTVYVLDDEGVIRFVDVRQEDLLKAVRQLVGEAESRSARLDPAR